MSYETTSRYRILQYDQSAKPAAETGGTDSGVTWPAAENLDQTPSMTLKVGKAVGFLLAVVVLCGVFFFVGEWIANELSNHYVGNRAVQLDSVQSEEPTSRPMLEPVEAVQPAVAPTEDQPVPPPAHEASEASPPLVSPKRQLSQSPLVVHGTMVLQVAALTHEDNASAMAAALQRKQYPVFVLMPTSDSFYRVLVGPYADLQAAKEAKRSLEQDGYEAIVRR